jgi:hypothetical protein
MKEYNRLFLSISNAIISILAIILGTIIFTFLFIWKTFEIRSFTIGSALLLGGLYLINHSINKKKFKIRPIHGFLGISLIFISILLCNFIVKIAELFDNYVLSLIVVLFLDITFLTIGFIWSSMFFKKYNGFKTLIKAYISQFKVMFPKKPIEYSIGYIIIIIFLLISIFGMLDEGFKTKNVIIVNIILFGFFMLIDFFYTLNDSKKIF